MKIYPIYHSGFMVELDHHILLFDYYQKALPITSSDLPLYVFASHKHPDHFNPLVEEVTRGFKKREFIFSNDIQSPILHHSMDHDETIQIDDLSISTLFSTDSGVAFIVEVEGKTIYHAGDLNLWLWEDDTEQEAKKMKEAFMAEMKKIQGKHFDLAFLPLESQQSDKFSVMGIEIFNEMTDTSVVFPMHFSFDSEVMEKRLLMIERNQNIVNTEKVEMYEF